MVITRRILPRFAPVLLLTASCLTQPTPLCKVTFSVVAKDDLNNIRQGFSPKTLEWYQKKMTKKYPDICYTPAASPVVMFFSATPATYHGVRTLSTDNPVKGSVTDSNPSSPTYGQKVGEVSGSVETSSAVPYEVDYHVLYLSLEIKLQDGTWKVAHNFSSKTLHPTMYGICTRNCHPNYSNIESALKWLHEGGLNDPTQSVLP